MTVTCLILKHYKSFLQRNGSLIFCQLMGRLSFPPPVVKHSLVNNVLPANAMVGSVSLSFFYDTYNKYALQSFCRCDKPCYLK